MIGQYLPNNNETAKVAFRQKICQLNSPSQTGRRQQSVAHSSIAVWHLSSAEKPRMGAKETQ
jgi:hypothetical protein